MKKCLCFVFFLGIFADTKIWKIDAQNATNGFVKTQGFQFILNGSPFYGNGFNAYWLMYEATDPSTRLNISLTLQDAAKHGLTIARTWAFNDGTYRALQKFPGSYDENSFQGLDFVVAEAGKTGLKLILSLVNNNDEFGGKKQYVKWAQDQGQNVTSEDGFFTNPLIKTYYKNNLKTLLTRNNSITGIQYKDDPAIMAWELINEPRCASDPSGKTLEDWITEMGSYVKSIDSNHLLEIGLEGYYGHLVAPYRQSINISYFYGTGTDFLAHNQISTIDFTTLHAYPDVWLSASDDDTQVAFLNDWLTDHIQDAQYIIKKPLIVAEFGKSTKDSGFNTYKRDLVFNVVYSKIYASARSGAAAAGGLFWQLLNKAVEGTFQDGYGLVLSEESSTTNLIAQQSGKLDQIRRIFYRKKRRGRKIIKGRKIID